MATENKGAATAAAPKAKSVIEQRKEIIAKNEEYVTVQLMKDNDKYSEPLFVSVNGENCVIQRGVPVQIKRKFANVISESLEQDGKAVAMMEKLSGEYKEKFKV